MRLTEEQRKILDNARHVVALRGNDSTYVDALTAALRLDEEMGNLEANYKCLADAIYPDRAGVYNPDFWTAQNLAILAMAHRQDSLDMDVQREGQE